jgi:thiol-disulfide isomerase/thioredoxin
VRLAFVFTGVAVLAGLAGTAMWLGQRAQIGTPAAASIAPTALYASTFRDGAGQPQALGQFQGNVLVVNFWATWCAPCREEMPAFSRVHQRWKGRGVRFVGLSSEAPEVVGRFAEKVRVDYPLWTGGGEVDTLSRRLGNHVGVLPHTVILDRTGAVLESKIGPFTETQLEERLAAYSSISR